MSKSTNLNFAQNINSAGVAYSNSDSAATLKTLYTASANDAVVKAINVISTDTSARVFDLVINDGSADYWIASVSIPATAGTTGAIATVDMLGGTLMPSLPFDSTGKRILPMKATHLLKVRNVAQLTSGKVVNFWCVVEEY